MTSADQELVSRAIGGDQDALELVVRRVQDPLYRLALRMTGRVADAEDATQEILIRVITRLSSYRGEAALVTWAYRIAVNQLINDHRRAPAQVLTFGAYRQDLLDGLAGPAYTGPDAGLLAEEIRLMCTQALLQCLDRPGRVAYVLGEIVRLPGEDAAWVLDVSPATYRKRLERARRQVRDALRGRCGLLDATAPCHCGKRAGYALAKGRIGPDGPVLATHPVAAPPGAAGADPHRAAAPPGRSTAQMAAGLSRLRDVGELLRSHPDYAAPAARTNAVLALVRSGRFTGLLD